MEKVLNKELCCGCSACFNACPTGAIEIIEDGEGFNYPKINQEKCINCGLCKKMCPVLNSNNKKLNYNNRKAYASYNKNIKERMESSSGGIFACLAKKIIEKNGLVVGAVINNENLVEHTIIDNIDNIKELCGSKYLESNINKIYQTVKDNLDKDKKVLFTGTPCQISGLKKYLRKDYNNLYTQDIICHGVPSKKVWRKYLNYIANSKKINKIKFRDKKYGWKDFSMRIDMPIRKYNMSHNDDAYMQLFLSNICLRPSCYNCQFKDGKIFSDITLGDFWGIENFEKEMDDNRGVSLLIINNEKGYELLEEIKEQIILKEVDLEKIIPYNSAIRESVSNNPKRNEFFKDLDSINFKNIINKYGIIKNPIKLRYEYFKKVVKKCLRK